MLRRLFILLVVVLFGAYTGRSTPAFAAAGPVVDAAVLAPIDKLVLGANAGSATAAQAAYVATPTIVDDFAPFAWSGRDAAREWTRALAVVLKQYVITDWRFARHAPRYVHVANTLAWLVIPSDFTFKLKGRPQKIGSAWTFVLRKAGARWRIVTSTWSTTSSTIE